MTLDRADFLRRWSELHEGIVPGSVPFVRGWLSIVYVSARPFVAARIGPSAVTLLGLAVAWGTVPATLPGGHWPVLAAALVLASALLDGLDGAVATLTARVSRGGALLDAGCDRLADAAYGVAIWALGAPAWLPIAWVGLSVLAEYLRARAQALLAAPIDVVTVGERPTRIIVAFVTLLAGGLVASRGHDAAVIGGLVGVATAAAGLAQLLWAVRRRLQ